MTRSEQKYTFKNSGKTTITTITSKTNGDGKKPQIAFVAYQFCLAIAQRICIMHSLDIYHSTSSRNKWYLKNGEKQSDTKKKRFFLLHLMDFSYKQTIHDIRFCLQLNRSSGHFQIFHKFLWQRLTLQ